MKGDGLYMLLVSMRKQQLESDTHKKNPLLLQRCAEAQHTARSSCALTPSPSCEAISNVVTKMKPVSTQVRAASQMTSAERSNRCPRKVAGKSLEVDVAELAGSVVVVFVPLMT